MKKVHLFAHLPKTGGTTIRKGIERHYTLGADYFHFAINGFKEMSHIDKSPYDALNYLDNSSGKNLILFGHRTNEGLLLNRNYDNVQLSTMLRHPFSRLVSQFYMRENSRTTNFNKSFNKYISDRRNPMCQFYISRFPSFINDPFDSLRDQAFEVFSRFQNIEFLENSPKAFERILNIYDVPYEPTFDSNRNAQKDEKKVIDGVKKNQALLLTLRQDLDLFYSLYTSKERERKQIDFQSIVLPNYWLTYLIKNLFNKKQFVIPYYNAIRNQTIKNLLQPQLKFDSVNYTVLLTSLIEIQNYHSLTQELRDNLFDLFTYTLSKVDNISGIELSNTDSFLGNIIRMMKKEKYNSLLNVNHKLILNLPDNNLLSLLAKSKYLRRLKEYNLALEKLFEAIKIYPLSTVLYEEILSIAKLMDDKLLIHKCIPKIVELGPSLPNKFVTQLLKMK